MAPASNPRRNSLQSQFRVPKPHEEKVRSVEQFSDETDDESEASNKAGKPARGRWLARLGLSDLEEE